MTSEAYTLDEKDLETLLEQTPGPRVIPEDIKGSIAEVAFIVHKTKTICIAELVNGFSVVGTADCVSAENFNEDIGRHYAYLDAVRQIWPLKGYALKDQLYREEHSGK